MAIKFKSDEQIKNEKNDDITGSDEAITKANEKRFKSKKTTRQKFGLVLLILSFIVTGLMIIYAGLPVFTWLVGIVAFIIWTIIILVATVVTIGLLWLSADFKAWQNSFRETCVRIFTSGSDAVKQISGYLGYIAGFGATIVVVNLVLAIYCYKKPLPEETNNKRHMVTSIVVCAIFFVAMIISIALNLTVYK